MKAADFDLAAMLEFRPDEGRLLLAGQRMLLFSQASLAKLDQLLVEHLGHEFADALFAQFGYRCGFDDFQAVGEAVAWDNDEEQMAAGPMLHMWEGIVHVETMSLDFDRATREFHMAGIWRNSYQAANHLLNYGQAREPVCTALTGYASGWTTSFFGDPMLAIETQCAAMGAADCRFEIMPAVAWDGRADRWRTMLGATSDSVARALEALVRKRTEELEAARVVAEQANRTKTQFLANISHELRTPMNGVIGVAQLLREEVESARERELVDLIIESGNQQVAIISDLLDYAKIESGQMSVERRQFDLSRVLGNVTATFTAQAGRRGVELVTDIDPAVPRAVISDSVKLSQILFNLLGNAVKFTAAGGTVTLQVGLQNPGETLADGMPRLRFEVRDSGIGMSAEQVDRLFTPFMQADASVTRRFGGTGLGLVITRELVTLLDGELSVQSELGLGSTFTVTLPLRLAVPAAAPVTPRAPAAPEAGDMPARRILVAEDNRINALVVRRMLEGLGATVQVVGDGREAVAAWDTAELPFDLVLLDLHMPEMDGMAAVARIRALEAEGSQAPTPVVALTADAFEETRRSCLAAGFDSFLTKPLDRELLTRLVRHPAAVHE